MPDEEKGGLLKAIMSELCSLSATIPSVNQRCIELNLPLDRGSIQDGVVNLRYGFHFERRTLREEIFAVINFREFFFRTFLGN